MPPVPRVSGREIIRAFDRAGWQLDRIRGSHYIYVTPDNRRVIVPVHGAKTLPVPTIKSVIDQTGLGVTAFIAMLRGEEP